MNSWKGCAKSINRELLKLKKELTKIVCPSREQLVAKALRVIFHDDTDISEEEAFKILGWDYKSREELFDIYDKDKITVTPYENYESIIFNTDTEKELEDIEGAIVFNLDVPD